jgi:hypothetical protein
MYSKYTLHTYPKVILYFECACILTVICHKRSLTGFSTFDIMLTLEKFPVLEHLRFWIFKLEMLNL